MPKKHNRRSVNVSSQVWDAIFDRKIALELITRKDMGMDKAIQDLLSVRYISEFAYWFELNFERLGFTEINESGKVLHPSYIMKQNNMDLKVALELRTSDFLAFYTHPEQFDLVLCLENDARISIPVLIVEEVEMRKQIAYTLFISKELNRKLHSYKKFDWAKFLQEKMNEKIKELEQKGEEKIEN